MAENALTEDQLEKIECFVTNWLSENRIPGAAVAIVEGADLVYAEGFGARNLKRNDPATEDTLYGVGSCTKSFTAAAVMQLVERDALSVSDPVDEYLPHLTDVPGDPITVRELLTHTSGMPDDGMARIIARSEESENFEIPLSSDADFRRHIQQSSNHRVADRETFFYYNSGYTLLGKIIETVSGTAYDTYVRKNLLEPLGMERSTFSQAEFENDDNRMTPYRKQDNETFESNFPFYDPLRAPGGLVSSATEMTNFLRMYIGSGTFQGTDILSSKSIAEMSSPVLSFGTFIDGRENGYGYGLMNQDFLGEQLIGHGGSVAVSKAWFGYLADSELGVVLTSSITGDTSPSNAGPAILALLKGKKPVDVVPHYKLKEVLGTVAGEYNTYRGIGTTQVTREGGMLAFGQQSENGGQGIYLKPETVTEDYLLCSTVAASGKERLVRFEIGDNDVDLYYERSHYEKET